MCRSLRSAVNKFGLRFDHILLYLQKESIEIWLGRPKTIYTTTANGSLSVIHNRQEKLIDGENFVERAAKDFKIVSNHAREIKIWKNTYDRRDIFTTFTAFLCSKKCILVEELILWDFSLDEILTILSCFDANVLKKLELQWIESVDQFKRITRLEHWENTEELKIWVSNFDSAIIVYCFHFKCFDIHKLDEFPAHIAIQIRDVR